MSTASSIANALRKYSNNGKKTIYLQFKGGKVNFYHQRPNGGSIYIVDEYKLKTQASALLAAKDILETETGLSAEGRERAMLRPGPAPAIKSRDNHTKTSPTISDAKQGQLFTVPHSTSPDRVCKVFAKDKPHTYREIGVRSGNTWTRFSEPGSPVGVGTKHPIEWLPQSVAEIRHNPTKTVLDSEAASELEQYAINTGELYPMYKAIVANLKKKIAKGVYKSELAVVAWSHFTDEAAKRYQKEYGSGSQIFNKTTRVHAAREIAKYAEGNDLGHRGNPTKPTKTDVKFLPEDQVFVDEANIKARYDQYSSSATAHGRPHGSGPQEATISLRRVPLSGDYDKDGRYFGQGRPLYIAELEAPDGYDHWYLRARSRDVAKALAHLRWPHVKKAIR